VKVEGSYIYRGTGEISVGRAKQIALERAQLETIANTFGTKISQYNSTTVSNNNGKSDIDFQSISSSDVQGEWIETIGEPLYEISYEQEMLIVKCHVKGIIREATGTTIDLSAKILRNGTEDKFESSEFKNGDDLYLSFQSPVDGYLAVYLVDADEQAFCLLPYRNQTTGIYPIAANHRYLFFNENSASKEERPLVDEYVMTCERSLEHNKIYVIFSPNQFVKAVDDNLQDGLPRQLNFKDFNKWLANCRKKDTNLTLQMIPITIEKK
jgi:hypothetical protein